MTAPEADRPDPSTEHHRRTPLSLFLTVAGRRLHVESLGNGPPLLLLHSGGGGFASGHWDEGCHRLARHYRLWRYERAGYGLSSPRDGFGWNFFGEEEQVLAELRRHLGLGPGLRMLGTSDGGTIAALHASRHPGSVAALVLEGAHGYFEESMARELVRRRARHDVKHPPGTGDAARQGIRLWFEGFRDPRWRTWSILGEVGAITCPTLVVQGGEDSFVGSDHAHRLAAAIPGARCTILPGARHLCHRSSPGEFYPLVTAFFSPSGA